MTPPALNPAAGWESGVTQTIRTDNSERLGNCVAACVATFLGRPLDEVPHFLEHGTAMGGPDDSALWWAMLIGYMSGHGYWPVELTSVDDAFADEVVFVAGDSPRGVLHQVLYRNGALLWDPHPSRAGLLNIKSVEAWRPTRHDHNPDLPPPAATEGTE